jgi:hypothetical protein
LIAPRTSGFDRRQVLRRHHVVERALGGRAKRRMAAGSVQARPDDRELAVAGQAARRRRGRAGGRDRRRKVAVGAHQRKHRTRTALGGLAITRVFQQKPRFEESAGGVGDRVGEGMRPLRKAQCSKKPLGVCSATAQSRLLRANRLAAGIELDLVQAQQRPRRSRVVDVRRAEVLVAGPAPVGIGDARQPVGGAPRARQQRRSPETS